MKKEIIKRKRGPRLFHEEEPFSYNEIHILTKQERIDLFIRIAEFSYDQDFLRLMHFDTDCEYDKSQQKLWRAILVNELFDINKKLLSFDWFTTRNHDFVEICEEANIDPLYIMSLAIHIKLKVFIMPCWRKIHNIWSFKTENDRAKRKLVA